MTPLKIIIPLTGLHCVSCVRMVERALAAVPGVASAHVDLASRRALVEYDPGRTAPAALEQAIEAAGYGVIRAGEGRIEDLEDRERVRETRALRARFFISAAFAVPLLLVSIVISPLMLVKFLTALALVSFILTAYYIRTERDMDFVYGVLYAFYAFFFVKWIRPYAFLTLRNGRWLTR